MTKNAKFPARITLELAELVEAGSLSVAEAERLASLRTPPKARQLFANILLIFGALAVVAGILALAPSLTLGLILAMTTLLGGAFLVFFRQEDWGFLGQSFVLMGTLGLAGWVALNFEELGAPFTSFSALTIALLVSVSLLIFRNAVLAVITPLAWGAVLGSGTAYWHASYALFVREATISAIVFTAAAIFAYTAQSWLPSLYHQTLRYIARTCVFMVNFAFWVGSLWGDYPGELWFASEQFSERRTWQETALFVPDFVFSLAWAATLAYATWWGISRNNRFVANTSIVFLAIHFYTQMYEVLLSSPAGIVVGGLILIGMGTGLFKFDQWLQKQAEAEG